MATLTIKGLPDDLYARLRDQAARNRRSLNNEAIVCLEQAAGRPRIDPLKFLAEADALRAKFPSDLWLTDELLDEAINEGRE